MKVVILTLGLPPANNGGAEIAAVQLAQCAAKMGHEMHIITMGSKPEIKGVTVHQVPTVNVRYANGLLCVPGIVHCILSIKPDLVHVQSSFMAPGAVTAKMLLGTKVLFYERGGIDMDIHVNKYIYPVIVKHSDRIIAQTEKQRTSLYRYTDKNVEVVPNGVDVERFKGLDKVKARTQLGLPVEKKIVLSVGRCRPEKNLLNFVLAAGSMASGRNSDTMFVLVGDGPQLSELKAASRGNVMFTGNVDNELVPAYMAASDVLVNTSNSEGFPMSLLEGMAAGLPVVAPSVCGIPELITTGVNGILTVPKDYYSTVFAINRILDNPYMAKRMSEANKEKAKLYTWERVVKELYR